jgi:NADH:ubiquinone oxidoreductase subunit 4 (subunit M)
MGLLFFNQWNVAPNILPALISAIGLLLVVKAYVEIQNPVVAWLLVVVNHFYTVLAVSFNEHFEASHTMLYLSGVLLSGVVGFACLVSISAQHSLAKPRDYHGWAKQKPVIAGIFLLAALGLAGFPITPTFIGEDLIYSHIHASQKVLILLNAAAFVVDGLVLIRLYGHLFMGPDPNRTFAPGYRTS